MSSDPTKQSLSTSTPLLLEDSLAPQQQHPQVILESQNELMEITQSRTRSHAYVQNDIDGSTPHMEDAYSNNTQYKQTIKDEVSLLLYKQGKDTTISVRA
ncbi:hypothetical protein LOD99_4647 [Oopsacas minuta]|uniref:Uncharacterized protein n=1 Tax=Oopsacas minuta TaxID=111878 RepID=A0AAV7JTI9_9METZ|nr:hypothetical protein LOD99_4647 [Oopsacas minuta]